MLIARKVDHLLNNFRPHKHEKSALKRLNKEENNLNLASKYLDTKNYTKNILSEHISNNKLFESKLLSSMRERYRFSD